MSFCFDCKCELSKLDIKKKCCKVSQLYGMVLFAQSVTEQGIKITAENVLVINKLNELTNQLFGFNFLIGENVNTYFATLSGDNLDKLLYELYIKINGKIRFALSGAILENPCCAAAFLRGAFMSAGYMTDPESGYHFEYITPYFSLANSMLNFLNGQGFGAKKMLRKSNHVIYIKSSQKIENMLYFLGANSSAFSLIDIKIKKELANNTNRIENCNINNLEKTINKSIEQIKAIKALEKSNKLCTLPEDIQTIAKLRLVNPDASLRELSELTNGRMSKSGINRRLNKIIEFVK